MLDRVMDAGYRFSWKAAFGSRCVLSCAFLAAFLWPMPPVRAEQESKCPTEVFAPQALGRAVLLEGDRTGLARVLSRADAGEPLTIAAIGGSITAGSGASTPERSYWWRFGRLTEGFPERGLGFVNAGIGATNSVFGALRAEDDLLYKEPDLVVIEFAVNDGDSTVFREAYEGLIRKILSLAWRPSVVLLFLVDEHGNTNQPWQKEIGTHYGLPMVSYADGVRPLLGTGAMEPGKTLPEIMYTQTIAGTQQSPAICFTCWKPLSWIREQLRLLTSRSNYPNPYIRMRSNSQIW